MQSYDWWWRLSVFKFLSCQLQHWRIDIWPELILVHNNGSCFSIGVCFFHSASQMSSRWIKPNTGNEIFLKYSRAESLICVVSFIYNYVQFLPIARWRSKRKKLIKLRNCTHLTDCSHIQMSGHDRCVHVVFMFCSYGLYQSPLCQRPRFWRTPSGCRSSTGHRWAARLWDLTNWNNRYFMLNYWLV